MELAGSIALLEQTVYEIYHILPILLIDEYDTPIMNSHEYQYHEDVSAFISVFYGSALKGQKYLSNALLIGIQRMAKESIFSKLNNVCVYTMLDNGYAQYFGLTEEETHNILDDYDLHLTKDVKQMYDGYHIGDYEIYNPWSVLNYCKNSKLNNYWVNTSSNKLIKECLKSNLPGFRSKFDELIQMGSVNVEVNLETSYTEFQNTATLWGLFVNAGYITIQEEIISKLVKVAIPNKEVKDEIQSMVSNGTIQWSV